MKVSVRQIYIKPGVNFPFSVNMQRWLSSELSSSATPCEQFVKKYGEEFKLVVNMSADTQLLENKLRGPAVYKRTKDVEYTLFLPYEIICQSKDGRRAAAEFLLTGIRLVFEKAGIASHVLDERRAAMVERLCADPEMLSKPWPHIS